MRLALISLLLLSSSAARQEVARPLPDLGSFLEEIKSKLRSDRLLQSQYTYTMKQTVRELDGKGKVKNTVVNVYEVYPSLEEGLTYTRLISKNGTPLSDKELHKNDDSYDKKLREHERKLQREGTDEKARRLAKDAEEQRKEEEIKRELFQLYDISMVGREDIDGHSTIHLAFQPRPKYKPRSREAGILMKVAGHAWFGEEDHELVRIRCELIDTFSIGLGMLVRLNKGTTGSLERRRVNDEIWLPAEIRFAGSARVLLLKGIRMDMISEYSDYKKYTVSSFATRPVPKNPKCDPEMPCLQSRPSPAAGRDLGSSSREKGPVQRPGPTCVTARRGGTINVSTQAAEANRSFVFIRYLQVTLTVVPMIGEPRLKWIFGRCYHARLAKNIHSRFSPAVVPAPFAI